jgi:nucleoside-diphosphate-sugar epimerase
MNVLVTGAAGFLGGRLIAALLAGRGGLPSLGRIVAVDVVPCAIRDPRVDCRTGSIADAEFIRAIVNDHTSVVYHLAAVLSGQSEAEFDIGMRINVDGTRNLLEACRRLIEPQRGPARFVFTSSVAVFGGPLPDVVPEDAALMPESSYGTEKAIGELLVSDYSRRGFVDGISCRLPTIAIRPGRPNSALSSFVSGIVREPLAGIESLCPVPLSTRLWISSPEVAIENLLHARRIPAAALEGRRAVTLPGLSVTVEEMLDSLARQGGAAARARVHCEPDPEVMRIVSTWPGAFDIDRPIRLGFSVDRAVDDIITQYISEHLPR